ncbi:MAG TPA: ShlB/FhaC/HecB family hemolysin secretion/activation protein [Chitinophagaceae bacterium]
MPKLKLYKAASVLILLLYAVSMQAQYELKILPVDRDSAFISQLKLQKSFRNATLAEEYIHSLPSLLHSKGFIAASVDSMYIDSLFAAVSLYVGESFKWAYLNTSQVNKSWLDAVGWNNRQYADRPFNWQQYALLRQKLLDHLENNGHPFAKLFLDSLELKDDGSIAATLKLEPGPLYKIDSIRLHGNARISNHFMQRYLDIPNGTIYKRDKLVNITKKIAELPYVQEQQPWDLTMLGTGSIVNLYLKQKKSSEINVLVGFLPSNQQLANNKLLVTGEANINLRNALGNGEAIGINWQQIQVKSPRLHLAFQQPYIFKSSFGLNTAFDLFKKDSSFVNINMLLGVQYYVSSTKSASIFVQNLRTNLLTIDTLQVLTSKRLPNEADVSSVNLGVTYEWNNTNYRLNPSRGNEFFISGSAGTRKLRKSEAIVKLKNPSDPTFNYGSLYDSLKASAYQFRVRLNAAHYFPVTRASTFKAGLQGGWFQSPAIFRNELFQIGGYKLLRGFDEESIFVSQFAVGTAEYRYLVGQNSFFFAFIDFGWTKNTQQTARSSNTFIGSGLGLAFETKAGIFNISYAAGKRSETKFDLRQSKIHLGYVNFF